MRKALTLALAATLPLMMGAQAADAKSKKHPRPPESFQGQWFTTPGGCSYSRAQAPGHPPQWILILNPHHIGRPPATRRCPPTL